MGHIHRFCLLSVTIVLMHGINSTYYWTPGSNHHQQAALWTNYSACIFHSYPTVLLSFLLICVFYTKWDNPGWLLPTHFSPGIQPGALLPPPALRVITYWSICFWLPSSHALCSAWCCADGLDLLPLWDEECASVHINSCHSSIWSYLGFPEQGKGKGFSPNSRLWLQGTKTCWPANNRWTCEELVAALRSLTVYLPYMFLLSCCTLWSTSLENCHCQKKVQMGQILKSSCGIISVYPPLFIQPNNGLGWKGHKRLFSSNAPAMGGDTFH